MGGGIASFDNHHKITDLRPELLSPFGLLFIRHLIKLEVRVRDMIFDEINDIGWLEKLREAKWCLLGKSTDELGKKRTYLQGFAARDLPQRLPLSWLYWSSKILWSKKKEGQIHAYNESGL